MNKISIYTFSGKQLDASELFPQGISIEDISMSLSQQCRYNGHTNGFYSVAEHCVHLVNCAREAGQSINLQKYLLLHDATEAYIGDVVYHLKAILPEFKALEDKIWEVILKAFDLKTTDYEVTLVTYLDRCICIDEMYQLMPYIDPVLLEKGYQPLHIETQCWPPERARLEFMKQFDRLFGEQNEDIPA